ncbi:MAG: hypothetical protein AAF798_11620, partial [Bacteroidota bacterium]
FWCKSKNYLILFVNSLLHYHISDHQNIGHMQSLANYLQRSAFGVCSYLGRKMGIASARVRLYFIYLSFVTLGSPIILYLFVFFWLNLRRYISQSRGFLFRQL